MCHSVGVDASSPETHPEGPRAHRSGLPLLRSLGPALIWSYLGAFSAGAALLVLALVAGLVFGVIWIFDRSVDVGDRVSGLVTGAGWVLAPVVAAVATGAAAYGSSRQRSWGRTLVGSMVALAVGGGLLLIDRLGWAMAGLAAGWGVVVPAKRFARIAWRVLPPIGLALAGPTQSGLPLPGLLIRLVASPLLAAVLFWGLDAAWGLVERRMGRTGTQG